MLLSRPNLPHRENDIYGKVYEDRKAYEVARNDSGEHGTLCEAELALRGKRMTAEQRAHYEAGRIPPGRVDLRAKRYAVKLYLSHLHHVMFESHFGEPPPKPYILTQAGHVNFVAPPNWPIV